MLGRILIEIGSDDSFRLYRFITENKLTVKKMSESKGKLLFYVPVEQFSYFRDFFESSGIEWKKVSEQGTLTVFKKLLKKKGLIIGSIFSVIMISIMSGRIVSFEVLSDNKAVRNKVMSVLYEQGITPGCSASEHDMTVAERELKKRIDEISWAGITVEGGKLIVDVVEFTDKPEYAQKRLPTNLIAREDALIEKVELTDGMLINGVGSAVRKGDIIVSGRVISDRVYYKFGEERHDIYSRYTRSIGKIYGTFERTVTFEQPYITEEKTLSDKIRTRYTLGIFDVSIPLFWGRGAELSTIETEKSTPEIFGIKIPISLSKTKLTDYTFLQKELSEREARQLAFNKDEAYQKNFLSDYEIKSREESLYSDEKVVKLTVKYKLYGLISEEIDFFIDK